MDYDKRIDNLVKKYNKVNYINSYNENNKKEEIIEYLNKETESEESIDKRIQKITDMVYYRDWNKLHMINKKVKILEFLDNLKKNNNIELDEIQDELLNLLKKKLLTKKIIQYDSLNGKILDILCLNKVNDKFIIKI